MIYFDDLDPPDTPAGIDRVLENCRADYRLGYRQLKVKIGRGNRWMERQAGIRRDIEVTRQIARALPDVRILVDANDGYTPDAFFTYLEGIGDIDLLWIEEPFEPHELGNFRRLREQVTTLVATGERSWNAGAYRQLIDADVADVVGCDPGRSEGVTGFAEVVRLVDGAGAWFNAHSWSSAINTAASLAVCSISPRCLLFELKPEPGPMQNELVEEPITQEQGWVRVPTAPGLGVEVQDSVVTRYRL